MQQIGDLIWGLLVGTDLHADDMRLERVEFPEDELPVLSSHSLAFLVRDSHRFFPSLAADHDLTFALPASLTSSTAWPK